MFLLTNTLFNAFKILLAGAGSAQPGKHLELFQCDYPQAGGLGDHVKLV